MHPARIAELLQPFLSPITNPCHSESGQRPGEEPAVLSATQLQHISTYIDLLLRWNARINLTAIRPTGRDRDSGGWPVLSSTQKAGALPFTLATPT